MEVFSQKEYFEKTFKSLNGAELDISNVQFEKCTFDGCVFSKAKFYNCVFTDCVFQACDLAGLSFAGSRLNGVQFSESKLMGISWLDANTMLFSVGFRECQLDYSNFFGMKLKQLNMINCCANEVSFQEADLTAADFSGTNLSRSVFLSTNLQKADFSGASNYAFDPQANKVKGARFSVPSVLALLEPFAIDIV